jgi:Flp pilus assembly protein TadD
MSTPPPTIARAEDSPAASLRREGLERWRANDFAGASEVLARAVALAPQDPASRLDFGIALQGAGRHGEAVEALTAAQQLLPNDAAPFLHAAVSLMALGRMHEALQAASDVRHRAPNSPQTHYT